LKVKVWGLKNQAHKKNLKSIFLGFGLFVFLFWVLLFLFWVFGFFGFNYTI
jgi:hypothetical protein